MLISEQYSPVRATAIHEAGHAVMAYLLRRPFVRITVIEQGDRLGSVAHRPPGEWFRPDIEINGRTRRLIEDHIMITLVGVEAEHRWAMLATATPDDIDQTIAEGARHDLNVVADFALRMCGSEKEAEAYVEWLRQRMLNHVGRADAKAPTKTSTSRFWRLVIPLADAVEEVGTLSWRKARDVLQQVEQSELDDGLRDWRAKFGSAAGRRS